MAAGPRPIYYLRAAAAGVGAALIGGVVTYFVRIVIPFGGFLLAIFLGYAIGEAVSWGARRNAGVGFQIIAAVSALIAFTVSGYTLGPGVMFGRISSPSPIGLLFAVIGIVVAVIRLRE